MSTRNNGSTERWVARLLGAAILAGAAVAIWRGWLAEQALAPPELGGPDVDAVLAEAATAARARIQMEPRSAAAWGEYGKLLLANEQRELARACFAQAERLDAEEPRWPYLFGRSLLPAEPEAALPHLRQAADLAARHDRDNPAPWLQLGSVLLQLGQLDEAATALQHANEIDSTSAPTNLALGLLADARGDTATAIQFLQQCLQHPATRQKAHARLAAIARQQGETDKAIRYSRTANDLAPDQAWPDPYLLECQRLAVGKEGRLREVEFLERQGRFRGAAAILDEMLHQAPDSSMFVQLSANLSRLGDLDGSESALQSALKLNPNSAAAHLGLAELYRRRGLNAAQQMDGRAVSKYYRAAVASARAAIKANPFDGQAHVILGLSLQQLGERDGALEALRTAVRLIPDRAEPLIHLAEAEIEAGMFDAAKDHLAMAARLAGDDDPRVQQAKQLYAKMQPKTAP